MPLSLDPTARTWITLANDKDSTNAPAFHCRFPTVRQSLALRKSIDAAAKADSDEAAMSTLVDAAMSVLDGWRGFAGEFGRDALLDVLTISELYELVGRCVYDTLIAEGERKKSALPSPSNAGASATAAATDAPSEMSNG